MAMRVLRGIKVPEGVSQLHGIQHERETGAGISKVDTWKTAKVGLLVFGTAALIYLSACDSNEHSFCIVKDFTKVALNLDMVASIFK